MQSASYEIIPELASMPEVRAVSDKIISGDYRPLPGEVLNSIIDIIFAEFGQLSRFLIIFVSLGLFTNIINLYGKDNLGAVNASYYALYAAVASVGIHCYSVCLGYAAETINEIADFITKISPILITLIFTSGKSISGSVFHPVLLSGVYIITVICRKCVLPLTTYSAILSVADNIGNKARVTGFSKFLISTIKWIMTLMFTVFTGICSIYGFSAPKLDMLSVKTAKFAVGSLVPVVGGFLSETLETVISGAGFMKNTIGVSGLIVMCTLCVTPVIKIGTMALAVRLCSVITEAVSDIRIANFLNDVSRSITTLFGIVATVAVMFIINISIIIAATG